MLQPSSTHAGISLNLIEAGLTTVALALAFAWPGLGSSFFARVERAFGRLARKRTLSVVAVGASALALRLAILPICPIPLPFIPDDFSFLLSADTFLHGRLANPTPAMWVHFESIHIDMLPTYGSMYFPAQGLLLAAGKVLFCNMWFGSLVAGALMCAALCWMLQAWLPTRWALLGGVLAVLRLALFSYWTNTYHSAGLPAALGGALVLGALPRFLRTPTTRLALLMALGAVLMAGTRPYEGLLLCLPVLAVLIRWCFRRKNRPPIATLCLRAAPAVVLLAAAAAWMGYYDYRAFGNPLTLPYTVNRSTYAVAPYYVWQPPRPEPVYRHQDMRRFYVSYEASFYKRVHSVSGFIPQTLIKALAGLLFFTGFALLPPLFMVRRVLLDRRVRLLVYSVALLAAGLTIEVFVLPHYLAPFTAAFYALGLQAMRHLRQWKPGGQTAGIAITRFIVTICVAMAVLRLFDRPLHISIPEWPVSSWNDAWYGPDHFGVERASIQSRLQQLPGNQLVIVRYSASHDPAEEWVYNDADIDGSKVIWARDMNAAENMELLNYYKDRKAWVVEPDARPVSISPYPEPLESSSAPDRPGAGDDAHPKSGISERRE
jgi:hypothetical protein